MTDATPPTSSPAASEGAASDQPRLSRDDFARQVEACRRSLWLIAAAMVSDRHAADDIVQEAAVIGLSRLARFEPGTNFRAWMAQIVRNVALNHRRRKRPADADNHTLNNLASQASRASQPIDMTGQLHEDQAAFDDHIVHALARLSEDARAALLLRTLEDMPYDDIAQLLQIPAGTAMSHVHRARQAMRRQLADEFEH